MQFHGQFCLSDDSHGVSQVATNYDRVIPFLQRNGIETLSFLAHSNIPGKYSDPRYPNLLLCSVPVSDIANHETFSETTQRTVAEMEKLGIQ